MGYRKRTIREQARRVKQMRIAEIKRELDSPDEWGLASPIPTRRLIRRLAHIRYKQEQAK